MIIARRKFLYMSTEYILKHKNTDFIVEEVAALSSSKNGKYSQAILEKSGITTLEAIRCLAEHFKIPMMNVSAAGLKDEDAVTKQVISLYNVISDETYIELSSERWLRLSKPIAFSDKPQSKGKLFGNNFWITIRNLAPAVADAVQCAAESRDYFNHYFINYFDHQRFGVPYSKYRTAVIGGHLLSGAIDNAAQVLYEESIEVISNNGILSKNQIEFMEAIDKGARADVAFRIIDPRLCAFFISSYFSMQWNMLVSQYIDVTGQGFPLYDQPQHPLYRCLGLVGAKELQQLPSVLPLKTALFSEETRKTEIKISYRMIVIPVKIFVLKNTHDTEFFNRSSLQIHFFLPSGCYGTLAVHQMLHSIMHDKKETKIEEYWSWPTTTEHKIF